MNKLLITVFLLCTCFMTNAIAEPYVSDSVKQGYLDWIKDTRQTTRTARFALAVAPNGAYGADWGYTIAQAKKKALRQCKKYAKTSPCEIVDVDGKSDFINTKIDQTNQTTYIFQHLTFLSHKSISHMSLFPRILIFIKFIKKTINFNISLISKA